MLVVPLGVFAVRYVRDVGSFSYTVPVTSQINIDEHPKKIHI